MPMNNELERLRGWINDSGYTVALTGAGVSTDSGLSDFRGPLGLYTQTNPWGVPPERILSQSFYEEHPAEFFTYYRTKLLNLSAPPNAIHRTMAVMESAGALQGIITQNGDRLHQKAGSRNVIELHGNVYDNNCQTCGKAYPPERVADSLGIPRCDCGGIIRPGIVLYDERPNPGQVMAAVKEVHRAELLIAVGTSLMVRGIQSLLKPFRGRLVILNLSETPYDGRADLVIHDRLDRIFRQLWL